MWLKGIRGSRDELGIAGVIATLDGHGIGMGKGGQPGSQAKREHDASPGRCWRRLDVSGAKRPIDRDQCVSDMGRDVIGQKRVTLGNRCQIIAVDPVLQEDGAGGRRQCQDRVAVDALKYGSMNFGHEHMAACSDRSAAGSPHQRDQLSFSSRRRALPSRSSLASWCGLVRATAVMPWTKS
ncbi:MAG: hypothetical protein JWR80_896 [Bradyrhizobium sp.]|nr:hypothetical protein [Bradyrhizobium sp.]